MYIKLIPKFVLQTLKDDKMKLSKLDLSERLVKGININEEITTKKVPVYAGMEFSYPGTKSSKMKIVGYDTLEFTYKIHSDGDRQLIGEKRINRVFN